MNTPATQRLTPVQALEQVRQVRGRHARRRITYVHHGPAALHAETHFHAAAGIRVAQGIDQQVGEQLPQAIRIPMHDALAGPWSTLVQRRMP